MQLKDCFESAGKFLMDKGLWDEEARKKYRLVHGRPRLQVHPHIRYGHAWIELEGKLVFDTVYNAMVARDHYYEVGQIDPAECITYTYQEMADKVNEHLHWGPWDLEETPEETELREQLSSDELGG